jgi:hypothetical protein
MQDTAAREVRRHLQWHRYEDAFVTLRTEAAHFGTFLPDCYHDA